MREQYLDSMDLERERGITIKAQNVRVDWKGHILHLIDTPGHVDFGYEVSRVAGRLRGRGAAGRRLPGHRGPDAGQLLPGHRARPRDRRRAQQDRPAGRRPRPLRRRRSRHVLGIPADDILRISAKTGEGVAELLDAVVERIPPPIGDPDAPLQALIFDCQYDQYRGVVSSRPGDERPAARPAPGCGSCRPARVHEADEIGVRRPVPDAGRRARPGRGRLPHRRHQGRRRGPQSGETVTDGRAPGRRPRSHGYRDPKPMVFCGLYPVDGDDFADLRESLEKLQLNDASITYEPETSGALGFGFRCGFLGLLHMEIVRERLEREFDLALIATAPSVRVPGAPHRRHESSTVDNPAELPDAAGDRPHRGAVPHGHDHHARATYTGTVMELCQTRRGEMSKLEYLSPERVELHLPDPAGRGGHRLLRPAEEPHPGLRQPRLRAGRLPARPTWCKVDILLNGVAGRRLLHHRAPRQGLRLRPAHDARSCAS